MRGHLDRKSDMADNDNRSRAFLLGFIIGGLLGAVIALILILLPSPKINLNMATAEELESLPGIGPAYAQRIIKYRQKKRQIASIEEIKKVQGIGQATFQKLKDMITVD